MFIYLNLKKIKKNSKMKQKIEILKTLNYQIYNPEQIDGFLSRFIELYSKRVFWNDGINYLYVSPFENNTNKRIFEFEVKNNFIFLRIFEKNKKVKDSKSINLVTFLLYL